MFNEIKKKIIFHYNNCKIFKLFINGQKIKISSISHKYQLPFLPVTFFKEFDLYSVPKKKIYKILYSSGTSGAKSKIYLDKKNAALQTKILNEILSKELGSKRLPMLILDRENICQTDRNSARTAAIVGFSMKGKKILFAFDKSFKLKKKLLQNF